MALRTLDTPHDWVDRLAFSPDASVLATAPGTAVPFWQAKDGQLLHTIEGFGGTVSGMAFSRDGTVLVIAHDGWGRDGWAYDLQLWGVPVEQTGSPAGQPSGEGS